ncbi:MAG TPA: HAMP domain-containing sensor histidine kinase [Flavobacteriaceae bacterium]|nr:HAMP domain-containing sensor histidine kinase [Flavobacteriaceae bacterium]
MEQALETKLKERIKELSCLYNISLAISKNRSISQTLTEICEVLKAAWQFSEETVVELKIADHNIQTTPLPKKTVFQESILDKSEENTDFVRIHYPSPPYGKNDFLEEEQKLLDNVANEIREFLEKERLKKQEKLLKRSVERNDRMSILGEITAGIAHELNTPLGNILGFAELIDERTREPQSKKDTRKIIKAAIYSREVVKKLMFFACEMPQNREIIRIKPIISEALSLLGPNFKKADVSYEFECETPNLKAQCDSIQLTQVLFNILINAIYVSPKNGKITLKLYEDPDNFFIEIADNGPGIPKEIKPKIFEPFFTTKPVGEGSGLGLSAVHGIVKSHRGEILCFDNEPSGTIFRIRMPLKTAWLTKNIS